MTNATQVCKSGGKNKDLKQLEKIFKIKGVVEKFISNRHCKTLKTERRLRENEKE